MWFLWVGSVEHISKVFLLNITHWTPITNNEIIVFVSAYAGCLTAEEERELTIIIISIIAVVLFCFALCCLCFCYYFCKSSPSRPTYSGHSKLSKFFCYCLCCSCMFLEKAFFKPKPPTIDPATKPPCVCSTSSDEEQPSVPVEDKHGVVVQGVVVHGVVMRDAEDNRDNKKSEANTLWDNLACSWHMSKLGRKNFLCMVDVIGFFMASYSWLIVLVAYCLGGLALSSKRESIVGGNCRSRALVRVQQFGSFAITTFWLYATSFFWRWHQWLRGYV